MGIHIPGKPGETPPEFDNDWLIFVTTYIDEDTGIAVDCLYDTQDPITPWLFIWGRGASGLYSFIWVTHDWTCTTAPPMLVAGALKKIEGERLLQKLGLHRRNKRIRGLK